MDIFRDETGCSEGTAQYIGDMQRLLSILH